MTTCGQNLWLSTGFLYKWGQKNDETLKAVIQRACRLLGSENVFHSRVDKQLKKASKRDF